MTFIRFARRKPALLVSAAVGLILVILHVPILNWFGRALVHSDPLQRMDAIVVLAGESERMDCAIRLFKQGYGRIIVFSGGPLYRRLGWDDVMAAHAVEEGVPKDKLLRNKFGIDDENSTYGEAVVNLKLLKQAGAKSFLLVTSSYHSARSEMVYRSLIGNAPMRMATHAVDIPGVHLEEWWRDRTSAKVVLKEWEKKVFYFFNY